MKPPFPASLQAEPASTPRSPSSPEAETRPTSRWLMAAALAWAGALNPSPIPVAGLHKIYLGQVGWGCLYLLLGWTPIPRVAAALEGIGYLRAAYPGGVPRWWRWGAAKTVAEETQAIAQAIQSLEELRQAGLVTEQEFEQRRRRLLEE